MNWPKWDPNQKKWSPEFVTQIRNRRPEQIQTSPNWQKWKLMRGDVPLYQAILLSLNLNPELSDNRDGILGPPEDAPEILRDIWDISKNRATEYARRFLANGGIKTDLVKYGEFIERELSEMLVDNVLPPEFPKEEKAASSTSQAPYMTEALRRLCERAQQFYEIEEGGQQKALADALANVLWENPSEQQKRAMQTLASIFRPEEERRKDRRAGKFRFED